MAEGFLEFARPTPDSMPSFADLVHDRASFVEEPTWLPQEFVYMGKDDWDRDTVRCISSRDFLTKPGFRLAWKKSELANENILNIEYAAPHLIVEDHFSVRPDADAFTATETVCVCKAEWEQALVFLVFTDAYSFPDERHTPHFVRFVGERVHAYRVVVSSDHSSLDYVSAVPEINTRNRNNECADEFIGYMQAYYSARPCCS